MSDDAQTLNDWSSPSSDPELDALASTLARISFSPMGGRKAKIWAERDIAGRLCIVSDWAYPEVDAITGKPAQFRSPHVYWANPFRVGEVIDFVLQLALQSTVHEACEQFKVDGQVWHEPHGRGDPSVYIPFCNDCDEKRDARLMHEGLAATRRERKKIARAMRAMLDGR